MAWKKYIGTELQSTLSEELDATLQFEHQKGFNLKVCVGTDSQIYHDIVEFATVIVIVVEGNGAFMFVNKSVEKNYFSLKERMIYEVSKSIETAVSIQEVCKKNGIELEVHADINADPKFSSNVAYSEAMGYIKGMGFIFKSKPFAFASTSCANRIVH